MKPSSQKMIIVSCIGIAAVILIGLLFWIVKSSTTSQNSTQKNSQTNFPVAANNSASNSITQSITILGQKQDQLHVKDFIHNGETVPDVENPGLYLLAGSLGYCLPNIQCTAATSSDFNIMYDSAGTNFTIALLQEPLSAARKGAEEFLMNRLGLSENQMCSLNYYVGTTYTVNESYDNGNLGFSFCPGAVQLP